MEPTEPWQPERVPLEELQRVMEDNKLVTADVDEEQLRASAVSLAKRGFQPY